MNKQEQKTLLRHLARTDLYFLLAFIFGRVDIRRQWLFDRCREVQEEPDGFIDLWAREHYKSTIITFGKTFQDILASHGDDPIKPRELTFGIFSHTRPIAKGFLRQIKREAESNPLLQELFPDVLWENPHREAPTWSEDGGLIFKRRGNPKEATVEAHGVVDGQPIGKHFDVLVYDDIVTPSNVSNPEMIKKTTEMLEISYNLGSQGGCRRFIGTRYHFFDTYKTIMNRKTATPRLHPARLGGTETGEPVFLTDDELKEKRRDQGSYTFGCQMLLNPKADSTQGFQESDLKYYDTVNQKNLNIYILVDPANTKKKRSDFTTMWVIGIGGDGKVRVLYFFRDKLSLPERTKRLFDLVKKYKPIHVRYEEYGMQADIEHIKSVMESETYDFTIVAVGGSMSKEDRIRRLLPKFEDGQIFLPRAMNYTGYDGVTQDMVHVFIEEEYKAFPVMAHDDMLDSLARAYEPKLKLKIPNDKKKPNKDTYIPRRSGWMG